MLCSSPATCSKLHLLQFFDLPLKARNFLLPHLFSYLNSFLFCPTPLYTFAMVMRGPISRFLAYAVVSKLFALNLKQSFRECILNNPYFQ